MGARATAITAAALLACAATLILIGTGAGTGQSVWRFVGFAATLVVTTLAVRVANRDPGSPTFFRAIILIAGIVLIAFAFGGVNL